MLFGHRLVARDCHKSILATSARQDWRLARAPSSTGYGDIALRAAKCPSSMSFPPSVHAEDSFSEGRPRHPWFRQRRRLEVRAFVRSEEHTSELQSLMRISYAVFCLKKKKNKN